MVKTDKKGHVVLERREDAALLFCGDLPEPYVIAHGYDEESGEWDYGTYFARLRQAASEFWKYRSKWLNSEYGRCGNCEAGIDTGDSFCWSCGAMIANRNDWEEQQ